MSEQNDQVLRRATPEEMAEGARAMMDQEQAGEKQERIPSAESCLQLREALREAHTAAMQVMDADSVGELTGRALEYARADERAVAALDVVKSEAGIPEVERRPRRAQVTTRG